MDSENDLQKAARLIVIQVNVLLCLLLYLKLKSNNLGITNIYLFNNSQQLYFKM